ELLVMDVALDVELGVVALAQRGGRLLEVGEALPQVVDLDVDLRVEDGRVLDGDLEGVVALDLDLGPDLDDGVELDVALLLPGGDLELGRGDRVEILGLDGLQVVVGHGVADGPFPGDPGAEMGLEEPAGRLPGPESGDPHLPGQLAEGGVDGRLELAGGDGDPEADLVALQRFDCRLHEAGKCNSGPCGNSVTWPGSARRQPDRQRLEAPDGEPRVADGLAGRF